MAKRKMTNKDITQSMRDELVSIRQVTIDGKPAAICGRLLDFPYITSLDMSISVEFSWVAVWRIVNEKQGKFNS
jgi:hypothetical protein